MYTRDAGDPPILDTRQYEVPRSNINITPQDVSPRLAKLEPYKSQEPDELHPWVLRELSNTMSRDTVGTSQSLQASTLWTFQETIGSYD